jgi:hypothetical protein
MLFGIYYAPDITFPRILDTPTKDDAVAALEALKEPFADFPFVAKSDRSCAVALTTTIIARNAIDGCCPIFLVRSPVPGTGKGLFTDVAARTATGKDAAKLPEVQGDEEERKRLFALALEGPPIAVIDNVEHLLGSAALAAFATAREFKDRVLGHSTVRSAPITTVLVATGNNLAVRGDLGRRVVPIDMDAKHPRPEERTGFAHPNLLAWCSERRPALVVAALTLLRAYIVAGRPSVPLAAFGSFEEWSGLVRSALVWTGAADPVGGRDRIRATGDPAIDAITAALSLWHDTYKETPLAVSEAASPGDPFLSPLRNALAALYKGGMADRLDYVQLGLRFRHYRDRPLNGLVLRHDSHSDKGVRWKVERLPMPAPPPKGGAEPSVAEKAPTSPTSEITH